MAADAGTWTGVDGGGDMIYSETMRMRLLGVEDEEVLARSVPIGLPCRRTEWKKPLWMAEVVPCARLHVKVA